MHFSCKISNSVLTYLDRRGADLDFLFDGYEVPVELLRDSAGWLDADKMERFLHIAETRFEEFAEEENLLVSIGHRSPELRAWGVLDSVFRMMQKPQDIFLQPTRLISYFVSPEPPLELVNRGALSVTWRLPVSADQYPKVAEYLRAAFESLPTYVGRSLFNVKWNDSTLGVSWTEDQESLVVEEERNLNPNLVQTIVKNLEQAQKDLEERNKELFELKKELAVFKANSQTVAVDSSLAVANTLSEQEPLLFSSAKSLGDKLDMVEKSHTGVELDDEALNRLDRALQQVYRYNDYMVRAQQLITLLIGKDRNQPQIREAVRRTDWEFVRSEYAHVAKEIVTLLQIVKSQGKNKTLESLLDQNRRVERARPDFRDFGPGDFGLQGTTHS